MDKNNLLEIIDESILKLRGYISKLPENKKVVVLFSGGLDSVSIVARCIVDYNLEVYPISIIRGQSNMAGEAASISFFNDYFLKRFPGKYHCVAFLHIEIPPRELKENIKKYSENNGYPLRDNQLEIAALQYAISLWEKEGKIDTIFTGVTKEDTYVHSSLLAMRSTTLMSCLSTPHKDWNISSINVDPYLYGDFGAFGKEEEIKWCFDHGIPIEKSRTCNNATPEHCGVCSSCLKRKKAFESVGVPDQTVYLQNN